MTTEAERLRSEKEQKLAQSLNDKGMGRKEVVKPQRPPEEQRILVGFEDITRFYKEHGRLPQRDGGGDIFERLYAVRLERLRALPEAVELLKEEDRYGLLANAEPEEESSSVTLQAQSVDDLARKLAGAREGDNGFESITTLKHVPYRKEINVAEEIASQKPCKDFAKFELLFKQVSEGLKSGALKSWPFGKHTNISQGQFFILKGIIVYVAEVLKGQQGYDGKAERLRVIYANKTESDLLSSSLGRALYKDKDGRKVASLQAGPLFEGRER